MAEQNFSPNGAICTAFGASKRVVRMIVPEKEAGKCSPIKHATLASVALMTLRNLAS